MVVSTGKAAAQYFPHPPNKVIPFVLLLRINPNRLKAPISMDNNYICKENPVVRGTKWTLMGKGK